MTEPLVVASDVHLEHEGCLERARRLARLVDEHAGHEIVLAGDIFNLSLDRPSLDPALSVQSIVAKHPSLVAAFRKHLAGGHALTFLSGNHDAAVVAHGTRERLLELFGLSAAGRLALEPWFIRRGGVHIEHGHAHDPDNAPAHPLALWSPETEPLGVSLTRRFLSPHDAFAFEHAHQTTPLAGLKQACQAFGVRTPLMILHYFTTSSRLAAESAVPERLGAEKARGAAATPAFAARTGLSPDAIAKLLAQLPRPTHEDFSRTFFRLYFDRVLATVGVAGGALRLLLGGAVGGPLGGAVALSSALYLHASVRKGVDRYSSLPVQRLHAGAALVRSITGATRVIFGHTHCEDEADGYINSASFTYTHRPGSPYLHIDTAEHIERREVS